MKVLHSPPLVFALVLAGWLHPLTAQAQELVSDGDRTPGSATDSRDRPPTPESSLPEGTWGKPGVPLAAALTENSPVQGSDHGLAPDALALGQESQHFADTNTADTGTADTGTADTGTADTLGATPTPGNPLLLSQDPQRSSPTAPEPPELNSDLNPELNPELNSDLNPELDPELNPELNPVSETLGQAGDLSPQSGSSVAQEPNPIGTEAAIGTPPAQGLTIQFLSPVDGTVLRSNSATVVLEASIGSRVELKVNGVTVDPNQIGQLETNAATGTVRQIWYGVIFGAGDNTLQATATLNGQSITAESQVQSPGAVAALRLTTIEKRVPADGRSTVTVQGFLLDDNGNVSNRGGRVTLTASSGTFLGNDASPDAQQFQVDAHDGEFTAQLQSPLNSGTVQIRADLLELEAFTQVQFETALRPSLVTGVIDVRIGAANTDYFGSFRDFLDPDKDSGTVIDLDGSAFATGPVGNWLLTAALNYDRPLNEACETCSSRLYRADQSSEKPYPVYGDQSSVSNMTPSQDQFYFRLEHSPGIVGADPDSVMWGDYSTGQEFATSSQEFSALSRQLHGAKVNYNFGNLQVSGLYSQGGEAYQRDTMMPDGTTGFYFLTERLVIPGSEEVYFELEELERPGTVIQRDRVQRITDYEIDYDRGSILFVDPVLRTEVGDEGQVLVRRMVITYQYDSAADTKLYGGRLRYHFNREQGQQSWLGTTYILEDKGERELQLYGVDAQFSLGENYKLVGEYAHSNNDSTVLGNVSGDAYRLEFTGKFSDRISGRAYYRHADTGFANQSTVSFVPGQTRYGAELDAKVTDTTQLRFRYDHEDNEGVSIRPIVSLGDLLAAGEEGIPDSRVDSSLTTLSAGLVQRLGQANLAVDWIYRDRKDRINPTSNVSSSQVRTRFTLPLRQNLRLSLTNETTLSASTDSVYNDRTQAGLDWRILPGVNLSLNQNWYTRGSLAGQSTTSANLGGEYRPWKNTTFSGRYTVENFSSGMRDNAALGVKQRWTVRPGLHLDAAYERIFGNLFMGGDRAVGQGASRSTRALGGDSLSLRASYTDNPNFQAQVQYEYRNSSGSQTSNVSASLMGKLSPSLTALFDADRRFASGSASRGLPATTQVRLGLAYRNPYSDRFNALLRYEYRQNPSTTPESLLDGSGVGTTEHLFAGEAIYSPNWQWEFYTKLGFRQSTLNLADSFTASSTVTLAQIRATYQVNRRFDLTGEARWIGQPSAGYSEMGWVGEVGFHATSNLRLALGYSSGSINNDRDFSGSRSAGGIYGGVTLKLDRLFQGFGLQQPLAQTQPRRQLTAQDPNPPTPAQLQAAAPSPPLRLQVSQAVDFTPNSAVMSPEGRVVLDSLATVMGQYGDLKLDMEAVLPPLAELTPDNLEARQLQAARQYLLSRGVAGDRITIRALNTSAAATGNTPVTFALKGPTTTFQLLSSQLGSGLVGSLLGQELPQLANLPRPSAAPGTPTAAPASTAIAAPAATPALPNLLALVNGVAIPLDQVPLDGAEPSPVRLPLLPPPADDLQAAMPRITGQFGSLAQAAVPNGITLAQGNPDRPGITPIGLSLNPDRAFWQAFVDAATPLRTAQRLDNPANGGETPDTRVSAVPNPSLSATGQGSDPGITAIARDTEQRLSVVPRAELGDAQGSTSIWSIGQLLGSSLGELAPQPTLTGLNPTALRLSLVPSLGAMPAPTLTAEPTTALDLAQAPTATPGFSPTLPSTAGRPDSIALWQTLSLWQALALNTEEATPDTFALNTENETPDTFALNTEGTPDNTLATGNTTNPDNTTALNLAVDRAFWRAMAEATTPLRTAQRPTANPNGFDISLMEARRLEAALTFLLSRDLNALDALLQASGTQAPEIRGELIDLDALMQQNQAGEGAL